MDGNAREALALERSEVVEGPFVAVGFSSGAALAMYVATQRPDDVRGVVAVGGAMPVKYLGDGTTPWPYRRTGPGAHGRARRLRRRPRGARRVRRRRRAGRRRRPSCSATPTRGHLFNEPGLPEEHNPAAAEEFYARLLAFVAD